VWQQGTVVVVAADFSAEPAEIMQGSVAAHFLLVVLAALESAEWVEM
jgi:hypothetical protein